MTSRDEQIGRNLVRLRGKKSQKDLADEMRDRGFKWSQATVWSVEKGERALRLDEAVEILEILNMGTFEFRELWAGDEESALRKAIRHHRDAGDQVARAISSFQSYKRDLEKMIQKSEDILASGQLSEKASEGLAYEVKRGRHDLKMDYTDFVERKNDRTRRLTEMMNNGVDQETS